jgi:hypothetical protein
MKARDLMSYVGGREPFDVIIVSPIRNEFGMVRVRRNRDGGMVWADPQHLQPKETKL